MVWLIGKRRGKKIARLEITGAIASETRQRVLKALKTIEDQKWKALLLRIDSPGGTVGDSQEIYSALRHLQKKMKIVASFGNISASGGVYIGMGAEKIVANPGTITGSIGVILRGNNIERLLDKVGVSFQVVKSGPYKDILSFDRELTEEEKQILQALIDTSYNQFVHTVAQARNLSVEAVHGFADGRIFTGEQAQQLGVVDRLGTEEEARRWLAEMANLNPDQAKCVTFGEKKSPLRRVLPNQNQIDTNFTWKSARDWLEFELATNGQPLWLYRP
ncbi:MAG: signal peptide peptidase SppA [Halothece sp.]